MKIGVISIRPQIADPAAMAFPTLYEAVGKNTGNFMFTTAMYRQLAGEVRHIGFHFDPAAINRDFNAVVVPAANWLNANADWGWLCDLIGQLEIPVVTIGIGLQANSQALADIRISESSLRLIRLLASKAPYISTRGNFTTAFLQSIGVLNAVSTGCPSLYLRPAEPACERAAGGEGVVVQSTRYGFTPGFLKASGVNRRLFAFAAHAGLDMVYQSEPEELEYLVADGSARLIAAEGAGRLHELYGLAGHQNLLAYLDDHGQAFFDIDAWSRYLRTRSGSLGTRLHGSILALNSGVPAVLFGHDSRTSELIDFARIPTVSDAIDLTALEGPGLERMFTPEDMATYVEARTFNGRTYRAFLRANGLEPREEAFF